MRKKTVSITAVLTMSLWANDPGLMSYCKFTRWKIQFSVLSFWLIFNPTTDYSSAHVQVLVLSRVSQSNMNNSSDYKIIDEILQFSPQSLPSNIYSCRELQLLSWVNIHYQSSRETLWKKGRTHGMHTYFITLKWCNDAESQCALTFLFNKCI